MCGEAWDEETARLRAKVTAEEGRRRHEDAEHAEEHTGTRRSEGRRSARRRERRWASRARLDAARARERAAAVTDASSNGDSSGDDDSTGDDDLSSEATGVSTSTTWPEEGWPDRPSRSSSPADFTDAELRASYRRVSLRAHPDKPGGSMLAFQRVAESYETLSDEDSRRASTSGSGWASRTETRARRGPCGTRWREKYSRNARGSRRSGIRSSARGSTRRGEEDRGRARGRGPRGRVVGWIPGKYPDREGSARYFLNGRRSRANVSGFEVDPRVARSKGEARSRFSFRRRQDSGLGFRPLVRFIVGPRSTGGRRPTRAGPPRSLVP